MKFKHTHVGGGVTNEVIIGNDLPFALISGPCQVQNRDLSLKVCECMAKITQKLNIPYIYKSSFDKANRNSINGKRGIGLEEGMKIFDEIRNTYAVPILTDVHTNEQPAMVAPYVDMMQQPAFLIRQTDLSIAIAKAGKACNLKKAQFQAPNDMKNVIKKYEDSGNTNLCLLERGTSFGYGDLIVDPRALVIMAKMEYPTVIDATHSVQKPAAMGDHSGGEGEMAQIIARSSLSNGCVGAVFIETHPEPLTGGSDTMNMIPLMYMEEILKQLQEIDFISKQNFPKIEGWKQEGMPIDELLKAYKDIKLKVNKEVEKKVKIKK